MTEQESRTFLQEKRTNEGTYGREGEGEREREAMPEGKSGQGKVKKVGGCFERKDYS